MIELGFVAERVLDGGDVFRLADTHGVPLPVQQAMMEDRGWAFDVLGFCRAAAASGNWPAEHTFAQLREHGFPSADAEELCRLAVRKAYL